MKHTFYILLVLFASTFIQHKFSFGDFPDRIRTKFIIVKGEPVAIMNGMRPNNANMQYTKIHLEGETLEKADFTGCYFDYADFNETNFYRCSFRGSRLHNVDAHACKFTECDFTDAKLQNSRIELTAEQLKSTRSYKNKRLEGYGRAFINKHDYSSLDFSGFYLKNVDFGRVKITSCDFTDAVIEGGRFSPFFSEMIYDTVGPNKGHTRFVDSVNFTKEQLMSTASYKSKVILGVALNIDDFTNVDYTGFNLTGCEMSGNLSGTDFTDAVITNCTFTESAKLTIDQVKSTWNYKTDNMKGVKLPKNIQTTLDAEKEKDKP